MLLFAVPHSAAALPGGLAVSKQVAKGNVVGWRHRHYRRHRYYRPYAYYGYYYRPYRHYGGSVSSALSDARRRAPQAGDRARAASPLRRPSRQKQRQSVDRSARLPPYPPKNIFRQLSNAE